jgi:hypothetical protein
MTSKPDGEKALTLLDAGALPTCDEVRELYRSLLLAMVLLVCASSARSG